MSSFRFNKQAIFTAVGAGLIAMALFVMCGWFFDLKVLMSVLPDHPTMKFNTALAFLLSGIAMVALCYAEDKFAKALYYGLAFSVFVMGLLTLLEIIFDYSIGIDQLFFRDTTAPSLMSPYPGRMVGSSALSFTILGLAFMGMRSDIKRLRHLSQYGLQLIIFFAAMALLGYCLQLTEAYKVAHFTAMAIHTSLAFLVMSFTLTFYNSSMGLTGFFTGKGLGNEMARKLFPAMALTGVILGYIRIKMFAHHLLSIEFGVAFSVIILSLTTLLWIWITAMQLNRLEAEKKVTDEANYKLSLDITAAQKLEKQKDEINKRNLLFVQQAPSAIAMFDTNMCYIAASEQWIKDYALQGLDIIGQSHYDIFPEIGNDWRSIHQRCLQGAVNKCDEARFVRADGTDQWITWDVRPWYISENEIGGLLMYTAEISHLKKSEILLKETTESLADAQQIAHVGSWDWNLVTGDLTWSDEQCRIFGFVPGTVIPTTELTFSLVHPDDKGKMIEAGKLTNQGKSYYSEFRIVRPDGVIRDIEAKGRTYRDNDGKPVRIIGTSADITERKKLERELMISEMEFRSAFENSASGMAMLSADFKWININGEFCKMVGYSESELKQLTFAEITYPEDLADNLMNLGRLKTREIERYQAEKRYIHKNGTIVWAIITVSMVFDERNAPLYYVAQITDITENKEMESKLRRLNSELFSIFNAETHVSMISTDLNGIITHFSKGAEILLRYRADEVIGRFSPAIFHDPHEVELRGMELSSLLGRQIKGFDVFVVVPDMKDFESREWTYLRKDGLRLPVQLVVSPTKDENGKINGYLGIATDITERKEVEETRKNYAVLESRNKEMEEFAYIASHDLQEPLRTVNSFVKLLSIDFPDQFQGESAQYLHFIEASTTRMSELIKGLLEFARIGKQKTLEPVNCNELVTAVVEDLGVAVKESGAVITFDDLPVINVFPTEMKQLFQNLISNAIKFRKPGLAPQIHISVQPLAGHWQFTVADNGIGIASRHFQKIFLLFQRLHNRGDYAGTGIGLCLLQKNCRVAPWPYLG